MQFNQIGVCTIVWIIDDQCSTSYYDLTKGISVGRLFFHYLANYTNEIILNDSSKYFSQKQPRMSKIHQNFEILPNLVVLKGIKAKVVWSQSPDLGPKAFCVEGGNKLKGGLLRRKTLKLWPMVYFLLSITSSLSLSFLLSLSFFLSLCLVQCDQMCRIFFQYLAIFNNNNLPNATKHLPTWVH